MFLLLLLFLGKENETLGLRRWRWVILSIFRFTVSLFSIYLLGILSFLFPFED